MKAEPTRLLLVLVAGLGLCILVALGMSSAPKSVPVPHQPFCEERHPEQETPQPLRTPESYDQALEMARAAEKSVFLFFEADWCSWCKKMKEDTLSKAEVKQALDGYIVYHVNTDHEYKIAKKYGVSGIPVSAVVTDEEEVIKKKSGYMEAKPFIRWLGE